MWATRGALSARVGAAQHFARTVRSNTTIASTVWYRCNYHDKTREALVCPAEQVKWSYEDLWRKIALTSGGLSKMGYSQGDIVATDLKSGTGNLLLQLAVSHLGMQVLTVNSAQEFEQLSNMMYVKGAVMSSASSFLSNAPLELKNVMNDLDGKAGEGVTDRGLQFAYYSSPDVVTNREVYLHGVGLAGLLEVKPEDKICVAAPLNSAFGLGSVICAIVRSATCYLPDESKFDIADSTLVSMTKSQLEKYKDVAASSLRGGVVEVGVGNDVLLATQDFAGTQLRAVGSAPDSELMRPLFDACKDTYYSYK